MQTHTKASPRICMPTARHFSRRAFQCGMYEAQDVLAQCDSVDLIPLESRRGSATWHTWQRRLLYHDFTGRLINVNPRLKPVRLSCEYDLFIAVCPNYWDLLYINAVQGWKDHCKVTVCWIDEMWPAEIPLFKHWIHWLRQFDYVFVGLRGTVAPLSQAIDKECVWLPGAVDCLRFTPFPEPPQRVVDVYSIGRRHEGIHQQLMRAAARKDIFYVYDTFSAADAQAFDHRQHRDLLANMTRRSHFFMVAPPKVDAPEETQGQSGIGYRYYEGAAAGAVMIGQAPACPEFAEMFPWPEAVIPVQPDGSNVLQVISELSAEPDRMTLIGERNAAEALLRHDWIHRWNEMLRIVGIEPSSGMLDREAQLRELADSICPISISAISK